MVASGNEHGTVFIWKANGKLETTLTKGHRYTQLRGECFLARLRVYTQLYKLHSGLFAHIKFVERARANFCVFNSIWEHWLIIF